MEADTRSIQRWLKNASEWLRPYSLTGDLRLTIFARVFALGTISSVLEFMLEQARIGPLTEYMERWSRLIPSTGWSSRTGLTLQFASAAISILIFILPCSRELLCLLAGTFLLAQLASPERIASHCSMMAGALLVILILAIAEWIDLAARGRKRAAPSESMVRVDTYRAPLHMHADVLFRVFLQTKPKLVFARRKSPELPYPSP